MIQIVLSKSFSHQLDFAAHTEFRFLLAHAHANMIYTSEDYNQINYHFDCNFIKQERITKDSNISTYQIPDLMNPVELENIALRILQYIDIQSCRFLVKKEDCEFFDEDGIENPGSIVHNWTIPLNRADSLFYILEYTHVATETQSLVRFIIKNISVKIYKHLQEIIVWEKIKEYSSVDQMPSKIKDILGRVVRKKRLLEQQQLKRLDKTKNMIIPLVHA